MLDSIPDSFAGFAPEKPEAKYKYDNPEAPENGEFLSSYILRRAQNFAKSSPYFCPM